MHKFDVNKQPKKENCITIHFKKKIKTIYLSILFIISQLGG